ncbi:hypothetical protein ACQVP2_33765 [Methylobacterium aquaticum]|uniref:hypothetical protein n=1 Tax=Methylobacterium aquaticum TaxID=270351 RepID=UPI003D162D03
MEKTPVAHLYSPFRQDTKQTGGVEVRKSLFDVPRNPGAEKANVARVEILERENFQLKRRLEKLEREFRNFRSDTIANVEEVAAAHKELVGDVTKRLNDDGEMLSDCYAKLFPEAVEMQQEIFKITDRTAKRKGK